MPARLPNPARADAAARTILREWRRLTGGRQVRDRARRTLVACSGGADSLALAIALSRCPGSVVVGHVLHDLRPVTEANADRDLAKQAAAQLGLTFDERAVHVPRRGNLEAGARKARYAALAEMARAHACDFIAVAHQGDDLIETVLMRLIRGAAPRGLAALAEARPLSPRSRLTLIRPMLPLTRADSERLCTRAGLAWATDATNADPTRLRANLRHTITPLLRTLAPGLHRRLARSTALLRDAAAIADAHAASLLEGATRDQNSTVFARAALRAQPALIIGECIRKAAGVRRADRLTARHLAPIIRAIQGPSTEPKRFSLASAEVAVSARQVRIHPRPG